ncbi:unnamed protein product [Didymodactylos carnosus]|uniref:NAD(+)--protein-arginine ADP-ribosyltransferase n=1 Tax=Didymodactylos carnosus TaxID=1234261 RepID=A0A815JXJ6_9BILA|nr:unnamed protein product [Didymodactylos carnosus]CAF4282908.1 unnamed protein product [Didymodactylos carnosus]
MTVDDIDQMKPNGSTALHVACYNGHIEIVQLLLEANSDRSIMNKYKCLPFDEGATEEIKELFLRAPNSNRLVSNTGAMEWDLVDDEVAEKAAEDQKIIKSLFSSASDIDKMFDRIEKNYIGKRLHNVKGVKDIERYFRKARKEQNPEHIIKAYTAETDFYHVLNIELASGSTMYIHKRRYIIALLRHHPALDKYSYTGLSFRGMKITDDDLKKYKTGSCLMTKSFLSTSVDRKVAEAFSFQQNYAHSSVIPHSRVKADGNLVKFPAICTYRIRHKRSGLHIENISQYPVEGEVLIMPHYVFKVQQITKTASTVLPNNQSVVEFELEECDPYQQ